MADAGRPGDVEADFLGRAHFLEGEALDRPGYVLGAEQVFQLMALGHALEDEILVPFGLLEDAQRLIAGGQQRRFADPGEVDLDDHLIDPAGALFGHRDLAPGEPGTGPAGPADIKLARAAQRDLLHADDQIGELFAGFSKQLDPGRARALALGILDPDLGVFSGPRGLGLDAGDLGHSRRHRADREQRHRIAE